MALTIGVAGRKHGKGRVAAFTKAFSVSDFTISGQGQDLLIRLFLNTMLWCHNPKGKLVFLHDTDNQTLNSKIKSFIDDLGFFCQIMPAWYSEQTITTCDARIIIPSYNANLGLKMPDAVQQSIMDNVAGGEGLIIGEWFHLLQSMPSRRSFSFSSDINEGLYTISPIALNLNKFVVWTKVDELAYIKTQQEDSMSYTLPPRFDVENVSSDVNFSAHFSQLSDIKDDAITFWITDIPAISNTTTTTTTTTTESPVESDDIKMKLFNVEMVDYCGPQTWYLGGEDADKFSFDGKHVYLTKNLTEEKNLTFDIITEDHFNPKRFEKKIKQVDVIVKKCNSPITEPKKYRPAYSYRGWPSEEQHIQVWGSNAITGIINDFSEWEIYGNGDLDDPKIAILGGMHGDINVLWLQLNNGGTVSGRLTTSLSTAEASAGSLDTIGNNSFYSDIAALFYVSNSLSTNIHPYQHVDDIIPFLDSSVEGVVKRVPGITEPPTGEGQSGETTEGFTFNIEDPNELDEQSNRVRGDAYLVLVLKKSPTVSQYDDKVYLEAYYGSISTTPPPTFSYNVFIINNVAGTSLSRDSLTFTSEATNDPLPTTSFTIFSDEGVGINSLSSVDNSEILTVSIGTIQDPISSRVINVDLEKMPVNGGAATIILSGSTITTTTPAPPQSATLNINFFNNVPNTELISADYGETYRASITALVNSTEVQLFSIDCKAGYAWYSSNIPSYTLTSSSPSSAFVSLVPQKLNDTTVRLTLTVLIPEGGGTINITIENNPPVPVTTTTTTTTPEPCSNLIQIICQQTLVCSEDADGNCQASLPISQEVIYYTCCDIDEEAVLSIIRTENGSNSTATLQEIYSSYCPSSTNTLLNPCQPKDQDGNCQETIHSVIIDEISCGSSENPLP